MDKGRETWEYPDRGDRARAEREPNDPAVTRLRSRWHRLMVPPPMIVSPPTETETVSAWCERAFYEDLWAVAERLPGAVSAAHVRPTDPEGTSNAVRRVTAQGIAEAVVRAARTMGEEAAQGLLSDFRHGLPSPSRARAVATAAALLREWAVILGVDSFADCLPRLSGLARAHHLSDDAVREPLRRALASACAPLLANLPTSPR